MSNHHGKAQAQEHPERSPRSSRPSRFEDLISQLQQAHLREVQELRRECAELKAGLEAKDSPEQPQPCPVSPRPIGAKGDHQDSQCTSLSLDPEETGEIELEDPPYEASSTLQQDEADEVMRKPSSMSRVSAKLSRGRSRLSRLMPPSSKLKPQNVFDVIEPKTINFQLVCMERFPGRSWKQLTGKERVSIIREELRPRHYLLNPRSRLIQRWDIVLAFTLVYVGLFTPYEVVFFQEVAMSFFVTNRIVDFVFVLDIILQFFLQVETQRPSHGGTMMMRSAWAVRMRYVRSWFLIDVISVFPFDILSLALASSAPYWQQAKITRCLRLVKLAKLLRMLRGMKLQNRWKYAIGIQTGTYKLIRFSVVLVLVAHWLACLWGLAGLTLGAELCDDHGQPRSFGSGGVNVNEVSWVTALYIGGKNSPDSGCNPFEVYVASLHFAVMTLTSIGYGDIVPVRVEEYIVGVLCMLIGGVLWAYVIGSVVSIISNLHPADQDYENNSDMLNLAMEEAGIPKDERRDYRQYLAEAKTYESRKYFRKVADYFSPMLKKQLLHHSTRGALLSVYYFDDHDVPHDALMDVALRLEPRFFSRFESLDAVRQQLCVMDRGTVAHCGLILVHPSAFNQDFIVAKEEYQKMTRTISLTYTQLLCLSKESLDGVLRHYPRFQKKVWRCALKRAFIGAVQHIAELYHRWLNGQPPGTKLSLKEAFDMFGHVKVKDSEYHRRVRPDTLKITSPMMMSRPHSFGNDWAPRASYSGEEDSEPVEQHQAI